MTSATLGILPGNELPQDIWELIAQFLPETEVLRLVSVNRALLNIALHLRYCTVIWVDPDQKMVKLLKRLEEPLIAGHVRQLQIRAWFMKRLLDIDSKVNQPTSPTPGPPSLSEKLLSLVDTSTIRVRRNTRPAKIPPSSIGDRVGVSSPYKSLLATMAKAMSLMVNVKNFTVEWRDLPFSASSHSFLTSANQSFGTSLCRLSLSGQLSKMEQIIPLAVFRRLEELELKFDYDERDDKKRVVNERILVDIVIPYINTHRGTLQSLKIISQAFGDHSRFFSAFPHLRLFRKLSLHIPFDRRDLSDPTGLQSVLRVHAYKLQDVEILPNRVREPDALASVKDAWMSFSELFIKSNDWLSNLASLSIPSVSHPRTMSVLQNMPITVRELRLAHRYHSFKEVSEVMQVLEERNLDIRKLGVDVITMTPKLFKLLAEKLPRLQSLSLVLEQAETSRRTFAELFPHYNSHTINWDLLELSIYLKNYREDATVAIPAIQWEEFSLMKTVKKILPSIQRSKGEEVFFAPPTV